MNDGISVGRRFVGVDLHLHRSVIAGLDVVGEQLGWVRIENDPKALVADVPQGGSRGAGGGRGDLRLVLGGRRAARGRVRGALAHPLGMKALRKRKRVKTDPADAYELANLLRLGSLPEAYISPPELRELRELVRHRRQLVKLATAVKAGIRALLAKHNIRLSATRARVRRRRAARPAARAPGLPQPAHGQRHRAGAGRGVRRRDR